MLFSLKTKTWNKSLFVFILLAVFSFGFLAVADEQETITAFFDDPDQDGLSTDEEKAYGTDPGNSDTDGDSYSDGVEVESGYDPLKPAPGDRIVPEETVATTAIDETQEANLTDLASEELVNLVAQKQDENNTDITNEDLNAAVANVLEKAHEEIVLPEIDIDKIKIKELSEKLDESEKQNKKREDTLEYLTTMSYILMSNLPAPIRSKSDLEKFMVQSGESLIVGLASGSYQFLDDLDGRADRIYEEIESVKVPENMLGTHVKALKLVSFLKELGTGIKSIDPVADPLGQMAEFSKMQGVILEIQNFLAESTQLTTALGITNIPMDLEP